LPDANHPARRVIEECKSRHRDLRSTERRCEEGSPCGPGRPTDGHHWQSDFCSARKKRLDSLPKSPLVFSLVK
jgi:hypothetical protein